VAIKTLHPAVAAMPGARARFLREGEAASRISHPNVVDVTDVATAAPVPLRRPKQPPKVLDSGGEISREITAAVAVMKKTPLRRLGVDPCSVLQEFRQRWLDRRQRSLKLPTPSVKWTRKPLPGTAAQRETPVVSLQNRPAEEKRLTRVALETLLFDRLPLPAAFG
jgi:serine/threonine protein kinase